LVHSNSLKPRPTISPWLSTQHTRDPHIWVLRGQSIAWVHISKTNYGGERKVATWGQRRSRPSGVIEESGWGQREAENAGKRRKEVSGAGVIVIATLFLILPHNPNKWRGCSSNLHICEIINEKLFWGRIKCFQSAQFVRVDRKFELNQDPY
jgi:hypothetical protein